jgi:predicted nucleic acid-binding protein
VLQGLTRDVEEVEPYLGMWTMLEPRGFSTYRSAAAIFRVGRSRGITLTTIDTLIAAIAIEHGAILFTLDHDFARVAQITSLRVYELASRGSTDLPAQTSAACRDEQL